MRLPNFDDFNLQIFGGNVLATESTSIQSREPAVAGGLGDLDAPVFELPTNRGRVWDFAARGGDELCPYLFNLDYGVLWWGPIYPGLVVGN